ncbi:MAG TPA: ABC transporter ATP-binding protein [Caulobacteraceae bacterium]|nr:ABC transporter ATP-binding protein [Caulobacteraceae bacterium]
MTAIAVRSVTRRYGEKAAVADASLDLNPGRITCLLGPSGCGKSTLLRLIAGLERPDAGEVRSGEALLSGGSVFVPPERRDIGLVFQDYALFPHLTVEKNVAFGLRDLPARERRARALAQLERVHMAERAGAWPQQLSGGEQQRVALARALAREPSVVLLDEPFSGLDGRLKTEVREAALNALRGSGAAVLIVTHDAEEAMMMADDLVLMRHGRILQAGTPRECYLHPVSASAARLLGETVELPAVIRDGRAITAFGSVPAEGEGPATVMARPEAFRLGEGETAAMVTALRYGGPFVVVELVAEGQGAVARAPLAVAPEVGHRVSVSLDPQFCAVFSGR